MKKKLMVVLLLVAVLFVSCGRGNVCENEDVLAKVSELAYVNYVRIGTDRLDNLLSEVVNKYTSDDLYNPTYSYPELNSDYLISNDYIYKNIEQLSSDKDSYICSYDLEYNQVGLGDFYVTSRSYTEAIYKHYTFDHHETYTSPKNIFSVNFQGDYFEIERLGDREPGVREQHEFNIVETDIPNVSNEATYFVGIDDFIGEERKKALSTLEEELRIKHNL